VILCIARFRGAMLHFLPFVRPKVPSLQQSGLLFSAVVALAAVGLFLLRSEL
jgi:hypothetical protein